MHPGRAWLLLLAIVGVGALLRLPLLGRAVTSDELAVLWDGPILGLWADPETAVKLGTAVTVLAGVIGAAKKKGNTQVRVVNGVPIYGSAQKTQTNGHWVRSMREAIEMARSGQYREIHLNRDWGSFTGGRVTGRKPDVAGVRKSGEIDVVEVPSRSDQKKGNQHLIDRNDTLMQRLPAEERGRIIIREITPSKDK